MKKKILEVMVVFAIAGGGWFGGYQHGHKTSTVIHRLETVEEMAYAMPDSFLKSNLLVVWGSHQCRSDKELSDILMPYALWKRNQLTSDSPNEPFQ